MAFEGVGLGIKINGHYYDYSSVEISIAGVGICLNISDINYSHKLDPGVFRGTSPRMRGRTRGTYDANAGFTIYREDFAVLKELLNKQSRGQGYMMASFGIAITYVDFGTSNDGVVLPSTPSFDEIIGCRIVSADHTLSTGNNPIVVKVDLSVMEIKEDGLRAVGNPANTGG